MATITRDAEINASAQASRPLALRAGTGKPRSSRATVLALLGGILAWEIVGRMAQFVFLPPFSVALQATWRMTLSGEIPGNIVASLTALLAGYVMAVLVAVPVGLFMGRYRLADYVLGPFVTVLLATPSILFVPVLFSLFGTSRLTQVSLVFIYVFAIVLVNARSGIQMVEASHVDMARTYGASERQIFRHILLPGAMPMIMAGLRMGMGRGVRAMINGEMLIVLVGMGALLRQYGNRFDAASVYGLLIVIIAIALVCTSAVQWIERRVTRWID